MQMQTAQVAAHAPGADWDSELGALPLAPGRKHQSHRRRSEPPPKANPWPFSAAILGGNVGLWKKRALVDKRGGGEVANPTGHPVGAVKATRCKLGVSCILDHKNRAWFPKETPARRTAGLGRSRLLEDEA